MIWMMLMDPLGPHAQCLRHQNPGHQQRDGDERQLSYLLV